MRNKFSIYHLSSTIASGFTLVELMIAVAMIAIIASAAITFLDPLAQIRRANDARRKSDLSQIQKALELYYQDYERYPNELNSRIVSNGSTIDWGQPWSPYMARVPKDPTGGVYVYKAGSNNQSYMLYAWLENPGKDPPNCQSDDTKTCKNAAPVSCNKNFGCNYGISSPNITP